MIGSMRQRRRTTTSSFRALIVFCLIMTTATSLLASIPLNGQSQLPGADIGSKSAQRISADRTSSSPSSLTLKLAVQLYAYYGSVVVADVDGDGRPEILINSYDGFYCLSGTGDIKWRSYTSGQGGTTPAIGDIDGDGKMEIVVAGDYSNRLYCLSASGAFKWADQSTTAFSQCSPTIADIHQDGKPVILVGSDSYSQEVCRLYCINASDKVEWSFATGGSISSSPTVADIRGDGRLEILVTGNNNSYCLNGAGALVWNFTTPGGARLSPAVADLNGDGKREVIVGSTSGNVYCLNASGSLIWSYGAGSGVYLSSASVADIDGDGKPEIFFSTMANIIYCLDGTGRLRWSFPVTAHSVPIVANIDLDGDLEVVFGTTIVYCLNSSGGLEWTYALGSYYTLNPLAVADVDLDGKPEIIVSTGSMIYWLSAFPEQQAPMPGSVLLIFMGLASTLIIMAAIVVIRRGRDIQIGSTRPHARRSRGEGR